MNQRHTVVGIALLAGACGGRGECAPWMAEGGGVQVIVMAEGGCGGTTWRADVTFADGRTQALAGEREGAVTEVLLGQFAGDSAADLAIVVEPLRIYGFVRQGDIFFGRELPAPTGQGPVTLAAGRLRAGEETWDPDQGTWRSP